MKTIISFFLTTSLLILFFACQKNDDANSLPICPESEDFGLLELDQESIDAIPYDYDLNEKLIFKNADNEEIVLFPQHPTAVLSEISRTSSILCDGQSSGMINYSYFEQIISYRSSNDYVFSFHLNVHGSNDITGSTSNFLFSDLLTIQAQHIDYRSIVFEDNCSLTMVSSFRGTEPFEVISGHPITQAISRLTIGDKTYDDVYIAEGNGEMNFKYTKQDGLISFTDVQGVEYIFDRKEAYNVNIAPNLSLPDINGTIVNLHDIEAELILIDFWASWCEPCRHEIQETLKPLFEEFKERGLEIYSVSIDENAEEWINAVEEDQTNWIHVNDLMGYNSEIFQKYEIYGVPTVYLLDQQKNILSNGFLYGEELRSLVTSYFD